ncbi:MAG: winged helix-turn-helix domain-containing protein [Thermoproteota archaeon]
MESVRRTELFETLAHETRIKILKALENQQLSFAELKRTLEIESSGNLQHHIAKLGDLIKQTEEGKYTLSDDGREALRILNTIEEVDKEPLSLYSKKSLTPNRRNLIALSLLFLVATVSLLFVLLQYLQLRNSIPLYGSISFSNGKVQIGGKEYYYLILNTPDLQLLREITFHGVRFSYQPLSQLPQLAIEQFSNNTQSRYNLILSLSNGTIRQYQGKIEFILINSNNVSMIVFGDLAMNNMSELISFPGKIIVLGNFSNLLIPVEYFKIEFNDGVAELVQPITWPQNTNALANTGVTTHKKPEAGVFKIGPNTFILIVSVEK